MNYNDAKSFTNKILVKYSISFSKLYIIIRAITGDNMFSTKQ